MHTTSTAPKASSTPRKGKGSVFFYSEHAALLNVCHKKLGYSRNEVMCLQNALVHWWEQERLPFPSDELIAVREGVSERTVRRWKSKAKKKGHLKLTKRYMNGRRVSDVWDLSGLVAAIDAYAEAHPNPYAMPERTPKPPRVSRPKLAKNGVQVTGQNCPGKYQKPMIMISPPETPSPPEDHDQDEIPLAVNAKRQPAEVVVVTPVEDNQSDEQGEEAAGQAPQPGARSPAQTPEPARSSEPEETPAPEPRPTLVERRAKVEQALAGAQAKAEKTRKQRAEKAASRPSYAERKAEAQKEAAVGPKAQQKANITTVNTAWAKAMAEYHPDAPREVGLSIPHRNMMINLISAWGVPDAVKLVWFTAKHWDALKAQFKNRLDDNPTLGFIQNYSQKLMQQVQLLEKYEALNASTDHYRPDANDDALNMMFNRLRELHLK